MLDPVNRQLGLEVRLVSVDQYLLRAVRVVIALVVLVMEVVGGPETVEAQPIRAGRGE
jgi:hypothetical protein